MKFSDYMKFVTAGVHLNPDTHRERLMLAGMGLGGEAGEVCDHAKKVAFHHKSMARDELLKEMGDVFWYFTLLANLYDFSLEDIMEENVSKLVKRYPARYIDWRICHETST